MIMDSGDNNKTFINMQIIYDNSLWIFVQNLQILVRRTTGYNESKPLLNNTIQWFCLLFNRGFDYIYIYIIMDEVLNK